MRRVRSRLVLAVVALCVLAPSAHAAAPAVSVFPSPGTRSALPETQITFRGISASSIGKVEVTGSKTGAHSGKIEADSDGQGGSFLPSTPFAAGETVTVQTGLNILGGHNGAFSFTIATPAGTIKPVPVATVPAGRNGVQRFRSEPGLQPAALTVTKRGAPASNGDIFVAPQYGPVQDGPMMLDPSGNLVWFDPVPKGQLATDFRVQRLYGKPVLTWWQGYMNRGSGRGQDMIYDTTYREVATVTAANGLQGADLHEFLLTNNGDAYIIGVSPVRWPGTRKPLMDSVVQEIDVKTGLVLFEWHALDHVPLRESYFRTSSPGHVFDPFHMNSIALDRDGNLIVSLRNTWAAYKIDHRTGAVIWTLGSSQSSFKMGPGTRTAFQHDLVVQPDGTFTIFDDGAGPPTKETQSRAIRIAIDTKHMTARLVKAYYHSPSLLANYEGGAQLLPNGDLFVGWGQQPYFSEFDPAGRLDFDAHFNTPTPSYRAYRFVWHGQPQTAPAIASSRGSDGVTTVYASWNGATEVARWQVMGGDSAGSLSPIGTAAKRGFETAIHAHSELPYFTVEALDSSGKVLGTSAATGTSGTRMSIFGHSTFISPAGTGGLNVGCFASAPCHVASTLTAGRTVLATTGREWIGAGTGTVVHFTLNATGRSLLARARGHQLGVTATVKNVDGATTSASTTLIPYRTSGPAPHTAITNSSTIQLLTRSAFVSAGGVGALFAACAGSSACHVSTTLSVGRTVIARTGSEFVGAGDCGTLYFTLTSAGRSMLAHARGNQLGAQVSAANGHDTASGQISLVRWG